MIRFSAEGKPISQGSMRAINNHVFHNNTKGVMEWRAKIAIAAKQAGCTPQEGPITIKADFRLLRPKSVKREFPIVPPDLDKTTRLLLDALTGVAYIDDAQVTRIEVTKRYAPTQGVDVEVYYGFDLL